MCLVLIILINGNAFAHATKIKYNKLSPERDTLLDKGLNTEWPDCPSIKKIDSKQLSDSEILFVWESILSENMEFQVEILEGSNKNLIDRSVTNTNSYYHRFKEKKAEFYFRVRTMCYAENTQKIIYGNWMELNVILSNGSGAGNGDLCEDLFDYLDFNTPSNGDATFEFINLPIDVIGEVDVCYTDTIMYVTSCETLNSATGVPLSTPQGYPLFLENISFTTSNQTVECEDQNVYDYGSSWCANLLDAVGFQLSYESDTLNGVLQTNVQASMDWGGDGTITMTQGQQTETVSGNTMNFTGTGCEPITVGVSATGQGNGGGEGCSFSFDPCTLPPVGPPDPPCPNPPCGPSDPPDCADINVNTFGYSNTGAQNLSGTDMCFVSFDSDLNLSTTAEFVMNGALQSTSVNNSSGLIAVPPGTTLNLIQEINYTDPNGNLQTLDCSTSIVMDCSFDDLPPDDGVACEAVDFIQNGSCQLAWTLNNPDASVFMSVTNNNGATTQIDMSETGALNEIGYVTFAEYFVYIPNEIPGEEIMVYCSVDLDPCVDDPDNDDEEDEEEDDDEENEDGEYLCEFINYTIDSTNFLPEYQISWQLYDATEIETEVSIDGVMEYVTTLQSGDINLLPGQMLSLDSEVVSQGLKGQCNFSFVCPESEPEDELDPSVICAYFELLTAEINTENSLNFTIAGSLEGHIMNHLEELDVTIDQLEDYLSQIESMDLNLSYVNKDYPNGNNLNLNIYDNPNGDNYNGSSSLFFDPINWTYFLDNISTIGLSGTFELSFVDIEDNEFTCNELQLPVTELEEDEEEENEFVQLNCGDDVDTTFSSEVLYEGPIEGKIITAFGFPILVDNASGSSSPYSGTGIIGLPLGQAQVTVDLIDIVVNENLKVIEGEVGLKQDSPANYPNFHLPSVPLNIGGDICLPEPPPDGYSEDGTSMDGLIDQNGFNTETGLHTVSEGPWDPNGFDINGNHVDGGLYNALGCSQAGFTENGNPCDPSEDDINIQNFIDSTAVAIDSLTEMFVKEIAGQLQMDLDSTNASCASLRSAVNGQIDTLGYDSDYIIGEQEEYLEEGMSENFASEPKKLVTNIEGRNDDTKMLEEKHVDLYACDKESIVLDEKIRKIEAICNDPTNTEIYDHIIALIQNWGTYQKQQYMNDELLFQEWIQKEIEKYIDALTDDDGFGAVQNPIDIIPIMNQAFVFSPEKYSATASTQSMYFSESAFESMTQAFERGDAVINGVHRAYYLEEMARLSSVNTGGSGVIKLPIELSKQIGSYKYSIYIDSISIDVQLGAKLNAHFIMEDTRTGKKFSFSGHDIGFGPSGLWGDSKLSLDTDVEIRLNNACMLILKGTDKTFVEWDCHGFKQMGIDTELEFCRNFIVPMNGQTHTPLPESVRYRLAVSTTVQEWLEFEIGISSTTPFSMAQYEDVIFDFENILVDMSSTSGASITPIEGYQSEYLEGTTLKPEWKGFYIGSLNVRLPNKFSKDTSQVIQISANDIIIDGSGVTGQTSVTNDPTILSEEDGNLSGWPFGINKLGMTVINNHVAGFGIGGRVNVPILKEYMDYEAWIYPDNHYKFIVSPLEHGTVDMFLASAVIENNSTITVEYKDGEFDAKANLTGALVITGDSEDDTDTGFDVPNISFTNLVVGNQAPYFEPGQWTIENDISAKFKNFSLSLSDIRIYKPDGNVDEAGIQFTVDLKLAENIEGVNATGGLGIVGKLEIVNERQKWVYDRIDPKSFCLNGSFPGVEKIEGCLNWYDNDSIYGSGFKGSASVKFKGIGIGLSAVAQFGDLQDYKYFFVDAMVSLGNGIPCGPFSFTGFGGGISHHMDSSFDPAQAYYNGESVPSGIGQSFSGTTYFPDPSVGLAFKGMAMFSLASSEELFNGVLELGMSFNSSTDGGGLRDIRFKGLGTFLNVPMPFGAEAGGILSAVPNETEGKDASPSAATSAPLMAWVYFVFNFNEPSFDGSMGIFMDAGVIKGLDNGKIIDAKLHFSPESWLIQIGTPQNPGGLEIDLLGAKIEASAYFVAGNSVPSFEPPPAEVREIAYKYKQQQALMQPGAGFVFGAALQISINISIAGIVDGFLNAGIGFDVMIKKFDNVYCDGEQIGMNGWYAAGQVWAYIHGGVKIMGKPIFEAGIAAILEARLPNPIVFTGTAGVKFKVGPISFNKSIQFSLGNSCEFTGEGTEGLGMDAISHINPGDNMGDVSTDTEPTVVFNLEMERQLKINDVNGNEIIWQAKLSDNSVNVITSNSDTIPATIEYSSDRRSALINPFWMLPSNDTIIVQVAVDVFRNEELFVNEIKEVTFYTGGGFGDIPDSNVLASYPKDGMYNFHKEEYTEGKGFVQLEAGQPELFYNLPEGVEQKMRLTDQSGSEVYVEYDYDPFTNRFDYELDPSLLTNGSIYKLELVRTGIEPSSEDENREATDKLDNDVLMSIHFRVSNYNNFLDKLTALKEQVPQTWSESAGMKYTWKSIEHVSSDDIIETSFNFNNNEWFKNNYKDGMYKILPAPIAGLEMGGEGMLEPFNGTTHLTESARATSGSIKIDKEVFEGTRSLPSGNKLNSSLIFDFEQKVKRDLNRSKLLIKEAEAFIQENICTLQILEGDATCPPGQTCSDDESMSNCVASYLGQDVMDLGESNFVEMPEGNYNVGIQYQLPDGTRTTSASIIFTK